MPFPFQIVQSLEAATHTCCAFIGSNADFLQLIAALRLLVANLQIKPMEPSRLRLYLGWLSVRRILTEERIVAQQAAYIPPNDDS